MDGQQPDMVARVWQADQLDERALASWYRQSREMGLERAVEYALDG